MKVIRVEVMHSELLLSISVLQDVGPPHSWL